MKPRTWIILGATSIIAEWFARLAAQAGHQIVLAARNEPQATLIANDLRLRYQTHCEVLPVDFSKDITPLFERINQPEEIDLFIAQSLMLNNDQLTPDKIAQLIQINVTRTCQLIHVYLHKTQNRHHVLFLSSVAAGRGRAKNSLYGASKAAVEVYLQGRQQSAPSNQIITIAKLGFIDTKSTYGQPGIFYASPPKRCAKACWNAILSRKRQITHPSFWRFILLILKNMPFFIYRKLKR